MSLSTNAPVEIRAYYSPEYGCYLLYGRNGEYRAKPLTFERVDAGALYEPFARLQVDEAQAMMNSLWDANVRPTEFSRFAGHAETMKAHIQSVENGLRWTQSVADRLLAMATKGGVA